MSTSAGNTDLLNSLNLGWRQVCLELFERSRHCSSHNTRLLIDCMCELGYLRTGTDITGIYWGSNRFASGIANLGFVFNDPGSESRPPMLNKENYVPWSSYLLRYAKSRPNGKLIHKSILNGPYVRRMILEPGDANRDVNTILLSLPEDIYAAVDSCETAQEIWLRKAVDELKAERLAKIQDPLALMENSNNPYASPTPHQDLSPFNHNYMQQPMPNPEDITDPTTAMNMALLLMAKAFKLNYSTPTNNNQRISSNPRNRQIAQPSMNMGQDRQMQMTQLLIAQKEEAGIQLQAEEYDLMAAAADLKEIKEVNANCILMANL
nr:hypothetical protein [Tanacetum cinerariifolium]